MKDIKYWNNFYKSFNHLEPSFFCNFINCYFESKNEKGLNILDAGCGNGRDSYYLAKNHNVLGVDSSGHLPESTDNCSFKNEDFCSIDKTNFDLIYSRFTLHSIPNEKQEQLFSSITKKNTYLCIETRSDKGAETERHYGDGHFRNFTNSTYLKNKLKEHNFDVFYFEESHNFAPYKEENPICIRLIARKN